MKKVLITGASSGIGKQLALDYAKAGWQVLASARSTEKLKEIQQSFPENITPLSLDVTNHDQVKAVLSPLKDLNLAILNAGTCEYVNVNKFDADLFERVYRTNLMGTVYCVEALLPSFSKGSQLAIVDSLSRHLPFTRAQAYGSSKAALFYLTKTLEVDLAGSGISVHAISPGFVKTPLTDLNDFDMPFIISVEEASRRIMRGLERGHKTVDFPRRLSWLLSFFSLLPPSWQVAVAKGMRP